MSYSIQVKTDENGSKTAEIVAASLDGAPEGRYYITDAGYSIALPQTISPESIESEAIVPEVG